MQNVKTETTLLCKHFFTSVCKRILQLGPRTYQEGSNDRVESGIPERIAGDLGFVGPTMPLLTEADFTKVTTLEPGYLGNLFVELMSAFEAIAATPEATPEFRIQSLRQTRGETKKTPGAPVTSEELLITDAEAQKTIKEKGSRLVSKMEAEKPTLATKTRALKDAFNKDGRTRIIEQAQNYRYRVDRINNILRRVRKLISSGKDQNNLGTALATSAGRAENAYQKYFYTDISKANDMLADLAKSMNITVQETLARLHMYAIHLHDPERRKIKYLREVPLTDNQAVRDRDSIIFNFFLRNFIELFEIFTHPIPYLHAFTKSNWVYWDTFPYVV